MHDSNFKGVFGTLLPKKKIFLNNIIYIFTQFLIHTYFYTCFQIINHNFLSVFTKYFLIFWPTQFRASPSVCAKLCKMKKVFDFTHFEQKNNYTNECRIMHKYTIAIITVHIRTITVACVFNILTIFSPTFLCLTLTSLSINSTDAKVQRSAAGALRTLAFKNDEKKKKKKI